MQRRWLCLVAIAMMQALGFAGCARQITLNLAAGPCLNPPDQICTTDGSDSRVLEFRVYQLKDYIDPTTLSWADLQEEGKDFDLLKAYLTDPAKTTVVRTSLTVQRNDARKHTIQTLRGTRYLLVVTAGRSAGPSSIVVTPFGPLRREVLLKFDYYDVSLPLESAARAGASSQPTE